MNPLKALVPDWLKKKAQMARGITPDLPPGVSVSTMTSPQAPQMNRQGRRDLRKQFREIVKRESKHR